MKYSLLDERDISLVHEYTFEARTEVDRNGCGASIFAFAFRFDAEKGKVGKYVQDVLWERHRGSIAPGHRVVHKNGISVDNRLENLLLVPVSVAQSWTLQHQLQQQRHLDREQRQREYAELDGGGGGGGGGGGRRRDDNAKLDGEGAAAPSTSSSSSSSTKHHPAGPEMAESPEQSLYWIAIQQLPQESMEEVSECVISLVSYLIMRLSFGATATVQCAMGMSSFPGQCTATAIVVSTCPRSMSKFDTELILDSSTPSITLAAATTTISRPTTAPK